MKQRLAPALCGSFCFVLLLVSTKIIYDIESTPAEVPSVLEDAKLIDVVNPKRKHNPIDDLYPVGRPQTIAVEKSGAG